MVADVVYTFHHAKIYYINNVEKQDMIMGKILIWKCWILDKVESIRLCFVAIADFEGSKAEY